MSKPKINRSNRSAVSAARQFGETALDNKTPVATPENVAFRYEVAGPFTRALALALDFLVLLIVAIILGVLVAIVSTAAASFFAESAMIVLAIYLLFIFLLLWFYGAVCETFWGKTIGKWVCKLRVLTADGRPINATQAVLRNFLRLADMMPGGGIGFLVMGLNRRFQRLGDLAAGTIVIHEKRKYHRTVDSFEDGRVIQLAEYIPASFVISNELAHTLSMYVQRRELFSVERTQEIAAHLAVPLLKEFGLPDDTSYDLLLCSLYYRTFLTTEDRKEREWRPPQLPPPTNHPQHGGYNPTHAAGYPQQPAQYPGQTQTPLSGQPPAPQAPPPNAPFGNPPRGFG